MSAEQGTGISAPLVIALGGNAISPPGEEGNIDQQFMHTRESVGPICRLAAQGLPIAITHGNGPQVGSVVRRVELAAKEMYTLPLHICVADTQAGMGYMIAQSLNNELAHQGVARRAACLVTMVEVDPQDPAFQIPTKPIGQYYPEDKAQALQAQHDWVLTETPHGFRRVVASPVPRAIVELEMIRTLVQSGVLLVAAGGGGIPVTRDAAGDLQGVEAVIDKDRTSALLAAQLGAEVFIIVTGVEQVAVQYRKPGERWLDRLTASEAARLMAEGEFPAGSMGPKIQAALDFLAGAVHARPRVIITDLEHLEAALQGNTGTQITRD